MPEYVGLVKYPAGSDMYGSAYGEPEWWKDFATTVVAEIAKQAGDANFIKPFTGTGGDLNTLLTPGLHSYWSDWTNRPNDTSGHVMVLPSVSGTGQDRAQLAVPYGGNVGLYKRFRGATGTWSAWERLDSPTSGVTSGAPGQSAAAFKTIPLALTVGGGGNAGVTSGNYRMPMRFGARIVRWRVHIRNNNPRFGTDGPAASISSVYFGPATAAGQFSSAPTLVASGLSTGTTGASTPWQTTPINPDTQYALAYAFTASATNQVVGGGWSASSVNSTTATLTKVVNLPLDVWIEAEVANDVPVVAAFGDSLSSGVGSDLPVYDSWISQWCRANGALPVHYAASGDTMQGWANSSAYKWQRWQHLSRPDAAVLAMGSNDVFGGASLDTLKERRSVALQQLAALVSPVVYSATIMPRSGITGAEEQVRRDYNTWVKTRVDSSRDVFDFAAAISSDDESILPQYDADSIHLNQAGYAALSGSVIRPLAPPSPRVGTGWRKLDTAPALTARTGGSVLIKRTGNQVRVKFVNVTLTDGAGAGVVVRGTELPSGFTPPADGTIMLVGNNGGAATTHTLRSAGSLWWTKTEGTTTQSGDRLNVSLLGEVAWATDDPWPTTLPGTPA